MQEITFLKGNIPGEHAPNRLLLFTFVSDRKQFKKKVKSDHHSKFSNLSNWKEEA